MTMSFCFLIKTTIRIILRPGSSTPEKGIELCAALLPSRRHNARVSYFYCNFDDTKSAAAGTYCVEYE